MIGRFLEDFAVGQTFRSGRVRIDKERIKTFGAEFDPQPFHLDEEAARDTIFGGLAASGWHTAAITMRLLTVPRVVNRESAAAPFAARLSLTDEATRGAWFYNGGAPADRVR